MLEFLVVIDVIIALMIVCAVFLHNGPDGFLGESTPSQSTSKSIKFEAFDKIIAVLVISFFVTTLSINYIYLYKDKGTAKIDDIIAGKVSNKQKDDLKEKEENIGAKHEAPLAE